MAIHNNWQSTPTTPDRLVGRATPSTGGAFTPPRADNRGTPVHSDVVVIPFNNGDVIVLRTDAVAVVHYHAGGDNGVSHHFEVLVRDIEDAFILRCGTGPDEINIRNFLGFLPRLRFSTAAINNFVTREMRIHPDTRLPETWIVREEAPLTPETSYRSSERC